MLMSMFRALQPILLARLVVPFHPAASDDQDIGWLEGNALFLGDGLEVGDGDFVPGGGCVCDVVFLGVGYVLWEDRVRNC